MEHIDIALVDWSRAQFALTAMFHWIFVPLTLGLSFLIAMMETVYVRTGDARWKRLTKYWMGLFGINFAIGVATGLILEFEFGTNWANYSWFVGDIFGAPLAIEGIMAFFMESTFIAVMFFGWDKVSKRFHLTATWLVAFGSNLSALWILVANAWMQDPVGMHFNPDTARNEMTNFWEVLLSPTAVNKFMHTVTSGYVLAAVFVVGVSSWYILKKRELWLAKRSILVAGTFGFLASLFLILTGDESARHIAKTQPMKFAAMEALYKGQQNAPLVVLGAFKPKSKQADANEHEFLFELKIPNLLSWMTYLDPDAFVPGIRDLVHGNPARGIPSFKTRIANGKRSIDALRAYKTLKKEGKTEEAQAALVIFRDNFKDFGYGYYFGKDPHLISPPVPITFYSFHTMVGLGMHFLFLFVVMVWLVYKDFVQRHKLRFVLWTAILSIPFAYVASQAGWIVAEMGRQPWVIQDLMPTLSAVSQLDKGTVQTTFWLFAITFSVLLIAEMRIMFKQIGRGPSH
ncbi:MAG: Cytochrome d ubiquinol oxidase subunit 1 [Bacteroidota bacterium]|jgi:cytochrome d ubiquinol oxidase subunit I